MYSMSRKPCKHIHTSLSVMHNYTLTFVNPKHTHTPCHKTLIQWHTYMNTLTMRLQYNSTHCPKLTAHRQKVSRVLHWRSQANNPTSLQVTEQFQLITITNRERGHEREKEGKREVKCREENKRTGNTSTLHHGILVIHAVKPRVYE